MVGVDVDPPTLWDIFPIAFPEFGQMDYRGLQTFLSIAHCSLSILAFPP
jgi:hypothetical protein